ncbi:MAG: hypothetical protein AAFN12_15815 [Cyanobacteria bacterium J06560_2]
MTLLLRPHRRQFVIGPHSFQADESWICLPLEGGRWLSHCPTLRIATATDANGCCWYLLGLAVDTLEERGAPTTTLAQSNSAEIPERYVSWAGRWLLIGQSQVHLDASGLLGCFYGTDEAGQHWASSSPALMTHFLSPAVDRSFPEQLGPRLLVHERGISWFPPPTTPTQALRRLLPSQCLDFCRGQVLPRPLLPPIDPLRPYAETVAQVKQSLLTALKGLAALKQSLWLGLTAGYDSRLMLALSAHGQLPIALFTRVAARMSVADYRLPPQLARACGYQHRYLKSRRRNLQRGPLLAEHSAGYVSAGDAKPFLQGVRDGLTGISIGGHGFAIASGFSHLRSLPATCENADTGAAQIAKVMREPADSSAVIGLRAWLRWALQNPQAHLDWRDRFFIEQRQAGWLSAKEQVYDLLPLERFPILNAGRTYALLLSLPENQRLNSLVQADLIAQIAPELAAYPYNPKDAHFGLFTAIASKGTHAPMYFYRKVTDKLQRMTRAATTVSAITSATNNPPAEPFTST